ncbi:MAG TPA: efflux RND transporter periplasmic adaptor subunit, partial [Polymorphobacter sp.]|nr:efflux RND transporter periplasmic adaptor subunit [Polymorphobacter sp.]
MRRIILVILAVAVLLAGIGYGFYWYTSGRYLQHTDNAYVEADIAVIAPKISGYVAKVSVTDNQQVARGDELLVLDPADYGATRDRLVSEVTRQQAAIGSAASTATAQAATIAAAEAALASARAEAERAEADRKRYEKLLAERWVPRATYELKVAEAASREAAVAQAQANVAAARANRTAALSGEGGARAAKAGAAAALESATLDLGNTVVRAPFDGVIGNRTVRVGQFVRVGQQVMVLVPLASVYVVANFKETQVGRM